MKYFPIKFHIWYVAITLLISFYGPKVYKDYDKFPVFVFILVYLIIVWLGFKSGMNSRLFVNYNADLQKAEIKYRRLLQRFILLTVILSLVNSIYLYVSDRLSVSISDIGANYIAYYEYYNEKKEGSVFTFELLLLVLSAIPKFFSLVFGFLFYSSLSKTYKFLFITMIVIIVMNQTLSLGNQKSLVDILIFGGIALLFRANSLTTAYRRKLVTRLVLGGVVLFAVLSYSQYTRLSSRDISHTNLNDNMASYSSIDFEHPVFQVFGLNYGLGITAFTTGYLSNGYYGLSKTIQMDPTWSYGIGNSVALSTIIEKSTGTQIYTETYLDKMEKKYNIQGKRHWHTIFPWFASDFSFPGTLLIFAFFSYLWGLSWKEMITYKNPVSCLLFSLLTVMFLFVPANNQIFHGFDYLLISFYVLFSWFRQHNKLNIPPQFE